MSSHINRRACGTPRPAARRGGHIAIALIICTSLCAPSAWGGPLNWRKTESPRKYGQNAVHAGPVGGSHVHAVVPLPANYWDSAFTLSVTSGTIEDTVTATHRARHKVALDGGEATPGPWWNAPLLAPPPAAVGFTLDGASGRRPHGHTDYFNHMLLAACFGPTPRLTGFAYASSGVHDPISCAARGVALLGQSAVPPTNSHAFGVSSLVLDRGDNTFVIAVALVGVSPADLWGSSICVGAPGEAPPICSFRIAGGTPSAKVSWRVEARRNDLRLRSHGAPIEREKTGPERGKYQHPEYYGLPPERGIDYRAGDEPAHSRK